MAEDDRNPDYADYHEGAFAENDDFSAPTDEHAAGPSSGPRQNWNWLAQPPQINFLMMQQMMAAAMAAMTQSGPNNAMLTPGGQGAGGSTSQTTPNQQQPQAAPTQQQPVAQQPVASTQTEQPERQSSIVGQGAANNQPLAVNSESRMSAMMARLDETMNKVLEALPSGSRPPQSQVATRSSLPPRPRPQYEWEAEGEEEELSDDFEQPTNRPNRSKKLPPFKRGPGRPRKVPAPPAQPAAKKRKTSSTAQEESVVCSVCYEKVPKAKLDSCIHCFCEECVLKIIETEGPFQKCPSCRKFFDSYENLKF